MPVAVEWLNASACPYRKPGSGARTLASGGRRLNSISEKGTSASVG